jgi:hypothetical protein
VGGIVIPVAIIGLCIGAVVASSFDFLSIAYTIPCCVAACSVATCPTPFTATIAMAVLLVPHTFVDTKTADTAGFHIHNDPIQFIGSIFVACLSAWAVTGGLGIIRYFETKRVDSLRKSNERRRSNEIDNDNVNDSNTNTNNNEHDNNNQYGYSTNDFTTFSDDEIIRDVRSTIFGNS